MKNDSQINFNLSLYELHKFSRLDPKAFKLYLILKIFDLLDNIPNEGEIGNLLGHSDITEDHRGFHQPLDIAESLQTLKRYELIDHLPFWADEDYIADQTIDLPLTPFK